MALNATFCYGNYATVHHTPVGAILAGAVVVVGALPLVAHHDIAAGALGVLAAGRGVYKMAANAAIAEKLLVYWDDATSKVSTTAGALKKFGYTVTAAAADGDIIEVLHSPG